MKGVAGRLTVKGVAGRWHHRPRSGGARTLRPIWRSMVSGRSGTQPAWWPFEVPSPSPAPAPPPSSSSCSPSSAGSVPFRQLGCVCAASPLARVALAGLHASSGWCASSSGGSPRACGPVVHVCLHVVSLSVGRAAVEKQRGRRGIGEAAPQGACGRRGLVAGQDLPGRPGSAPLPA